MYTGDFSSICNALVLKNTWNSHDKMVRYDKAEGRYMGDGYSLNFSTPEVF